MTGAEIEREFYRSLRACHRAWLNTQPQFVIPGVLDEADAGTDTVSASVSSSAAPVAGRSHTSPGRGPRSIPPKEDK